MRTRMNFTGPFWLRLETALLVLPTSIGLWTLCLGMPGSVSHRLTSRGIVAKSPGDPCI
jgi:hypothetical protein